MPRESDRRSPSSSSGRSESSRFVPGLLAVLAIGLSVLTIHLDELAQLSWARSVGWIWAGGPDGARKVLSTIASSMIGMAGVTFSINVVALQLASTQFGPRVLRNFMTDTGNQVVLGTFVATFLYCLLVLRTVRGLDQDEFVPNVSVTAGVILAVLGLAVRSLSPGINDPYTAVICIDWISACLTSLARKAEPNRRHCDGEGHLRIAAARTSFGDVADAAFHPIREYGNGSPEVMARALHAIAHAALRPAGAKIARH
ncbi:MAG: DUF2254 family protein [Anaerolineales bacterium]